MVDLLHALLVGLSAAGLVVALRALPFVQRLIREQKKPWACDVCMSFWCTGATAFVLLPLTEVWAAAPGFAIALLTLRKLTEPLRLPSNLPKLPEEE